MIRTYLAEHGGTVFVSTPTQRQRRMRSRLTALAVVAAVAASAGTVQAFADHQRASVAAPWTP